MVNLILCGGSGTRLWPISRENMPKQYIKLFSGKSLFQLAMERNADLASRNIIISNVEQYFLAKAQIPNDNFDMVLEPVGRNTAPAVALACFLLDYDDIMLVSPSDHIIRNLEEYENVVKKAQRYAKDNYLVTFGIVPTEPNTGYGYIEADGEDVKQFHEKPSVERAAQYIYNGYYWNSGIFCFKAGVFLNELKKYAPEVYKFSKIAYENADKSDFIRIAKDDMLNIPSISVDYAVMEKSNIVKVIPSDIGWSDLGCFDSLKDEIGTDDNNNMVISDKTVEILGIKDIMVVDTPDALLVCNSGMSQEVKEIVEKLKDSNPDITKYHTTTYRPWGCYTILNIGDRFKVKKIVVDKGCRISLQKHEFRNEHWVIVSGKARVTVNEKIFELNENESTYIKAGEIHRLENIGDEELEMIEVQSGSYVGEDDIIRFEDDYRRI